MNTGHLFHETFPNYSDPLQPFSSNHTLDFTIYLRLPCPFHSTLMFILASQSWNCIQVQRVGFFCVYFSFTPHSVTRSAGHKKKASEKSFIQWHLSTRQCQSTTMSSWPTSVKFNVWCHRLAIDSSGVLIQRAIAVIWRHFHTNLWLTTYTSFLIIAK